MRALAVPVVQLHALTPLVWCRDEYIAMGLSQVAQAVSFLNVDCKMVSPRRCRRCKAHRS